MEENENKYLGIDWGGSRIGLSLGDGSTKIATPFEVVGSLSEIIKIIESEKIDVVVVGVPVKMSGSQQGMTEGYKKFLNSLYKKTNVKVKLIDERLTSKAADALPGRKKDKAKRDAIAAMLILQHYFEKENS